MNENTQPSEQDGSSTSDAAVSEEQKRKKNQSFERELIWIRRGIDLTLNDPGLKDYASDYGYNAKKVGALKDLLEETQSAYEAQKEAYVKQRAATRLFKENWRKADVAIKHIVDTARLAFKNDADAYDRLGLKGTRKHAFGEWVAENELLYKNILIPETVAELANFKITQEELDGGNQDFMDTITSDIAQKNAKAEAQKATALKNKA
ncbi:MAG: hypothetical protein GY950_03540, partial [bacterium]|nr:hypothetical protein [bacterium]